MSTAEKIQRLTDFIQNSKDHELINIMYAMVEDQYTSEEDLTLSKAQEEQLANIIEKRKREESKLFTLEEVQNRLNAI